jgi:hypothetical protein
MEEGREISTNLVMWNSGMCARWLCSIFAEIMDITREFSGENSYYMIFARSDCSCRVMK